MLPLLPAPAEATNPDSSIVDATHDDSPPPQCSGTCSEGFHSPKIIDLLYMM